MTRQADSATGFSLQFLGANNTVTGSRYLVRCGPGTLLVDCGLFQGYKTLRLRNWAPFPIQPAGIDAVLLTHAHLDHSGYLPRLTREGFRHRVWCTRATRSLCRILLPDSARLLEEEADFANRKGSSRHHPAQPLYTEADAMACLNRFNAEPFDAAFEPVPGVRATFRAQGHILGAASLTLEFKGRRLTFSGDIGRTVDPVMPAPAPLVESDWVVTESTYGNRLHAGDSLKDELLPILQRVIARGGVAILPAFAVGRAQSLLHVIAELQGEGHFSSVPVYLNSPMATKVTDLLREFPHEHRLDTQALDAMQRMTHVVDSVEASRQLNLRKGPMIIVSASGMLTGGRVLHHVLAFGPDPRNAIILCGYQAGGTRGASLVAGARRLRIYGQDVSVAAEVVQVSAGSAHADADEIMAWLRTAPRAPEKVFVTHGEPDAADALRLRIERELGWSARVPEFLERVELL